MSARWMQSRTRHVVRQYVWESDWRVYVVDSLDPVADSALHGMGRISATEGRAGVDDGSQCSCKCQYVFSLHHHQFLQSKLTPRSILWLLPNPHLPDLPRPLLCRRAPNHLHRCHCRSITSTAHESAAYQCSDLWWTADYWGFRIVELGKL